jgi:hypothetical protein
VSGFHANIEATRMNLGNAAVLYAFAGWLSDNGRDDEAAAVRVFFSVLQENLERGATLDETLAIAQRNAGRLARRARLLEEPVHCQPSSE